jgi:hypothetical protein
MYARPATENIPLGLQYRPGDGRPRPGFRPIFRPHPVMIVRQGMEQYRPDYRPGMDGFRPIYRPRPNMDPKFRPHPSIDRNYRPAPPGMYGRPLPARPLGGSEVNYQGGSQVNIQGGSDVGYSGVAPVYRRASHMDYQRTNPQPGPTKRTSLLDSSHRSGSPSSRRSSQMDVDVAGGSSQNLDVPIDSANNGSSSTTDQANRNSVPVSFGDSAQRFSPEHGMNNSPRPFDPSRPLYRGPPMMQSFDNGFRRTVRPPPQRPASYHYPQGYYRPSQSASFHSSDSNSVHSASFRPIRPSLIPSELGLRSSPEPEQDSPLGAPSSPGKRRFFILDI